MSGDPTFDFSGARVLVTGGTAGIGHAIAHAFATAGATVTVTGTRDTADEYSTELGPFRYHQCRLTEPGEIEAVAASLDGLDVLVNNAGQVFPGGLDESDPAGFEASVAVNLTSAYRLAVACHGHLAASELDGGASIVNLASMSSYFGIELVPGYGAAKTGILGMTRSLAMKWARDGIRVNAVAPGIIETNMTAPMVASEEMAGPLFARIALGRWGTPEEIAPPVLFLASPGARYITGQTVPIDGGFSIYG
jgi:NAD(P)-dependent dehydrogenase (short-subunit alcohol dehydrogenase family)